MDSDANAFQELRFELTRLATALVGPLEAEDVVADVVTRVLGRPGVLASLQDPRSHMVMLGIQRNRKMTSSPDLGPMECMFAVANKPNEEETPCTHG